MNNLNLAFVCFRFFSDLRFRYTDGRYGVDKYFQKLTLVTWTQLGGGGLLKALAPPIPMLAPSKIYIIV